MVATTVSVGAARAARPRFYVWMAAAFVLIAFGGFIPTYWAKMATGSFTGAPILHIHGALFFSWTLFFLFQSWQVAAGRVLNHRNWGMAGISLATAMGITVILAAINSINVAEAIGMGDAARRFSVVSLSALVVFAGLFGLAIAQSNKPEVHKRLMILASVPLAQAATARIFQVAMTPPGAVGPPPVFVSLPPGLVVDLLIVAAMIYDWRTRGRPHPVYLIGGAVILAVQLLVIPVSGTPAWMSIARGVEGLTG
ncbi:MAG: hypothetical protein IT546_15325 [Caulobacteraceae bacterium]|nr:hypothetical protein [Caulobacteraceae bacterium]